MTCRDSYASGSGPLIEQLKTRGAPFVVSCALHAGLVAGLVLTHHWVSSAVALHPPVLPVQLVTLEAPAPPPPPAAPIPPRAPVTPPRLLAPRRPKETPVARPEERPVRTGFEHKPTVLGVFFEARNLTDRT